MSIFVNPDHTFPVRIKFRYVFNNEGDLTGVRILPADAEGEDVQMLECFCTGRDFDTMSRIKEAGSIVNHITGEPMIHISILARQIILNFFKSWNVAEEGSNPENPTIAPINAETVGRLHYNIVKALARQWLQATDGKP